MSTSWKLESQKEYPKLNSDLETDVLIIGGGLAGILTAYKLNHAGKNVVVIEKDQIGKGTTEYTTAHLTHEIDTDISQLVEMFGEDEAKKIWKSHAAAIDEIEKIVTAEKIDCEFMRCPSFTYVRVKSDMEDLKEEIKIANHLGFKAERVDANLGFAQSGSMKLPNQAKFHPLKFLNGVAEKAQSAGVQIYEQTEATEIKKEDDLLVISTDMGKITANKVIVATYDPFNHPKQLLLKKGTYVSYVLEVELEGAIEEALYWDVENPYNYFRIDKVNGKQRMILGGADHRHEIKMDEEKNHKALEEYLNNILPDSKYKITKKWKGPILEPSDGLALIGEYKENEYVATAFSGNGMTYSMISALILSDLITGKSNPWAEIYNPKRIPNVKQLYEKAKDYTGELFGGAAKNIFK